MNVVSHKAIRVFCATNPGASTLLDRWYLVVRKAKWKSFVEVRETFNTTDFVAFHVIFDIGGNNYRLVAGINFKREQLYIRHIMTHKEYDKGAWKL